MISQSASKNMFQSGSTKLVKDLNQQHILNLVRMNPGISASEIKNSTGLQMSTVAYTLKKLKEIGYLNANINGESTLRGGKPPQLWELNPGYGYIVGLELMPYEYRVALLDFSTKILQKITYPVNNENHAEELDLEIKRVVDEVLKKNKISNEDVLGLGIAIPGLVNRNTGTIEYSSTFNIRNIPIQEKIQPHFKFPVEIANYANAGALAIKWVSGSEHIVPNIIYATINQSFRFMGLGLIFNHELYEGSSGCSGEIPDFMTFSQLRQLFSRAEKKYGQKSTVNISPETVEPKQNSVYYLVKDADNGSDIAKNILQGLAKRISKELVRVIDLLAPDIIVIGGDACVAEKYLITTIKKRVSALVFAESNKDITIEFAKFGKYSVAIGSTALISQKIFRPN